MLNKFLIRRRRCATLERFPDKAFAPALDVAGRMRHHIAARSKSHSLRTHGGDRMGDERESYIHQILIVGHVWILKVEEDEIAQIRAIARAAGEELFPAMQETLMLAAQAKEPRVIKLLRLLSDLQPNPFQIFLPGLSHWMMTGQIVIHILAQGDAPRDPAL